MIDVDPRVLSLAASVGAKALHDYTELHNGDIDFVVISLPPKAQPAACVHFLGERIPVFCEKPIAMRVQDGSRLTRAVRDAKVPFMTGFMFRYSPASRMLRRMRQSGELGQILTISLHKPLSASSNYAVAIRGRYGCNLHEMPFTISILCHGSPDLSPSKCTRSSRARPAQ